MIEELLDDSFEAAYLPFDDDDLVDELGVRSLLLGLFWNERERDRVKGLRDRIRESYDLRLDELDARMDSIRQQLANYVVNVNGGKAVSLPDVGTAGVRKVAETVRFEDGVDTVTFARELGTIEHVEKVDLAATRKALLEQLHSTGELPRGVVLVPERQTAVVKRA